MSFGRLRDASGESGAVLLSSECRTLQRALRPLVWVTLEDVAFDAVAEGGRLVARTSARQVAEHVGVDPTAAARALRVLRDRGVVQVEADRNSARRFGLSVYVLGSVPGLTVVGVGSGLSVCPALPGVARGAFDLGTASS